MQHAILSKLVQDAAGIFHRPREIVTILGPARARARFDLRSILPVRFANGIEGILFDDELEEQ